MYRIATASIAVVIILAGATVGATHVANHQARAEAAAVIAYRDAQLTHERQHWNAITNQDIAAHGSRDEAMRTLDMLQELYAQEKRLWHYYRALDAQLKTRSRLAEERAELERRVSNHESRLRELDASVEILRPSEDTAGGIQFTAP